MPPAPALLDDVVEQILLRFPPDDPACLVRACLVCKPWRLLLTSTAFLRSYRLFHGPPPMLGFLHRLYHEEPCVARFVPTAKAFLPQRPCRRCWYALDARHGRALFYDSEQRPAEFVVWDPVTDFQRRIPLPEETPKSWNAAVLCAVEGCDHLDCHGDNPFLVAFVGTDKTEEGIWTTSARFYSSEASTWSDATSVEHPDASIEMQPSVLSGNAVYFLCDPSTRILRCDFVGDRELSVIDRPAVDENTEVVLITAEDGALGFAGMHASSICFWSMELGADGAVAWLQYRILDLGTLLPSRALTIMPDVIGFAEVVDVIFVRTVAGIFTIELNKSDRVRKVSSRGCVCTAIPYTSFYTPDRAIRQFPQPMRMQ